MDLTSGRNRVCKNNIGGLKIAYIFPFVKYRRSEVIVDGVNLVSFPDTVIYPFEIVNSVYNESTQEDKSINQSLTLEMIGVEINPQLLKMVFKDHRIIAKDRKGQYRLIGAYNGVLTELTQTTGGNQSSFSGYQLSVSGQEKQTALFIDNLEDAGFEIYDPSDVDNYIFEDGNNYIFEDGNNFIFN